MGLVDAQTGHKVKSILDAPAEADALEGAELEAARQQVQDAGNAALERLAKLDLRGETQVTVQLLIDALEVESASMIDFVILHTRRRCVLREDAAADAVAKVAPLWKGVWQSDISFASNSLVVDKSALWISERPTALRPGTADSGWRLAIKSPR